MVTKEYANWNRAANRKIQAIAATPLNPAGVENSATKKTASGAGPKSR